ncbi:MAG TPA: hypothetical protein VN676_12895 [Steroidobacteraceae bacterium]|jgi:hypothetical protein|nr:hypothetical protein [Steroidobacteraceae bacterium]
MHFLTTGARALRIATAAALGLVSLSSHAQSACDEKCLKGFMDSYLQALAKHDPASLALADRYRYTENGATLELGKDALWATFNAYGPYRHDVFDPSTGGVATYVSLTENHEMPFPDLLMVRLKVVKGKISEIETVVDRHASTAANLPPKDPSWMQIMEREEPVGSRLSRKQLEAGALGYLRSVAFRKSDLAPYAESCIRLENGNVTALGPHDTPPVPIGRQPTDVAGEAARPNMLGIGCGKQLDYSEYSFITGYEDAHFPIVDEKRQLVFATFDFMRRGNVESWTYQGHRFAMPEGMREPNEILNTEIFKFVNGKISRVEAVFEGPQAYKRGTGWPGGTAPESRPEQP